MFAADIIKCLSCSGFAIESCYIPAGDVGGDFFQILPAKGGGLLVVIVDVSGKGMPAAMTVSLLVGTVRCEALPTDGPGEMLAAMYERMLGRSHGGFTTCLALRIDVDGTLTIANAGHLAPYLAGCEVATENGLPLGLSAATEYTETTIELHCSGEFIVMDGQRTKAIAAGSFVEATLLPGRHEIRYPG